MLLLLTNSSCVWKITVNPHQGFFTNVLLKLPERLYFPIQELKLPLKAIYHFLQNQMVPCREALLQASPGSCWEGFESGWDWS